MKVFVFTALLLFLVHIVRGQDETGNITPWEAKDLKSKNTTVFEAGALDAPGSFLKSSKIKEDICLN